MPKVINRIPDALARFETIGTAASWQVYNGVAEKAGRSAFLTTHQTLRITPSTNGTPITLETSFYADSADLARAMLFSTFVRCHVGATVTTLLCDALSPMPAYSTGSQISIEKNIPRSEHGTLATGGWTVARSNSYTPPNTGSQPKLKMSMRISVADHSALVSSVEPYVYISIPACYGEYDFQNNQSALYSFLGLPQVFRDYEKSSTPEWPIFRMLDVLNFGTGISDDYANEWTYVDYLDGFDGTTDTRSKLVDPVVAPITILPWLNQFVGSKSIAGTATRTPWASIPTTWGLIDSEMDENADGTLEWDEFEAYSPSFANSENSLRWQASTGFAGYAAGSYEAIEAAVKFVLTGTKSVDISIMGFTVETSPYKIVPSWTLTVTTYVEETPDVADVSDTSALVEGIINDVKPIGIKVIHELIVMP
jgi:hypothetical protein